MVGNPPKDHRAMARLTICSRFSANRAIRRFKAYSAIYARRPRDIAPALT